MPGSGVRRRFFNLPGWGADQRGARRPVSVCDASLYAEALTSSTPLGSAARRALLSGRRWDAPAILPAEVLSAIRGLSLGGKISEHRAARARKRLGLSNFVFHQFVPYADRIWELRANLTVYDAWYVAVAEVLGVSLVTTYSRMASSPGIRCEVIVV